MKTLSTNAHFKAVTTAIVLKKGGGFHTLPCRGLFLTCLIIVASIWSSTIHASNRDDPFELFHSEKYREAFPLLHKLARDGHPRAQGKLARMYGNGWGTKKDEKEAYYWASRGITNNDPTSLYVIGFIHWRGLAGFNKNRTEAIRWLEKAANADYERAICDLIDIYESTEASVSGEKKLYEWYERGVSLAIPCAMHSLGSALMFGSYGKPRDHPEAAKWLEKSAAAGVGKDTAGRLFMFGDDAIRDGKKAEHYLSGSIASGLNSLDAAHSAYILAEAYLFGEGAVEENRSAGHTLLKKLAASDFKYFSHELESRLYDSGIDRPRSSHKAILEALEGMQSEITQLGEEEVEASGTWAGHYAIEAGLTYFIDLPDHLELKWHRIVLGTRDEQGHYEKERSKYSKEVVAQSEGISLADFFSSIRGFLEKRVTEIGKIEPRDLINEGWSQFVGKKGLVDEPLAQFLTEEGLRLALRTKNEKLQSVARNNLGVILGGAANTYIRNIRLANVHLYDGRASAWGADNMLWSHYTGAIKLGTTELDDMRDRYRKETGSNHRTQTMPIPDKEFFSSSTSKAQFLRKHYVDGDTELAGEIAWTYESNAIEEKDYQDALYWFRLANDTERSERIKRIINGSFVREIPNYNNVISKIFGIETNDTRGGTVANLRREPIEARPINTPVASNRFKRLEVHALVIGNNEYRDDPLRNSINDARAIAKRFKAFGFSVTEAFNLKRNSFRDMLIKFAERAKNADVTIFFYAGHGMQLGGVNYLLPTDIDFSLRQEIVTFDGISLNELKGRHLPGATKLIFIDACRNNPFSSRTRGLQGRGLAPVNVGTGTLISFATRDGSVALDSVGGTHSPYTQGLLKHINSNEDVEIMLRAVGDEVMRLTNNFQQPWKYGALSGEKIIIPTLANSQK